jgi:hypothetical protein
MDTIGITLPSYSVVAMSTLLCKEVFA